MKLPRERPQAGADFEHALAGRQPLQDKIIAVARRLNCKRSADFLMSTRSRIM
jgi:hypothetical protein